MPHPAFPDRPASAWKLAISTQQAAIIGAIAVLLSAGLSLLAGVVSATIAGHQAARATAQQLNGETERSKAEFLRGQRQTLYATLGKDMQDLHVAERQYEAQIENMTPVEADRALALASIPVTPNLDKLGADGFSVAVISSSAVRTSYYKLAQDHQQQYLNLRSMLAIYSGSRGNLDTWRSDVDAAGQKVEATDQAIRKSEDAVMLAARAEMGVK